MPNRYCAVCHELLSGKQKRFCSDAHRSVWWNDLRARAVEKPPVSEDPEIQSFFNDFVEFMKRHDAIIRRLLK